MLKGENKFNVSAKDINLLGSEKFRAYGSKNTLLGKNGIELGAPNITTKLSGYSGVAKSEANKTKQNVAQITKHNTQVAQQQKTEEEKAAQRQQEQEDMIQVEHNFYDNYADWIQEFIDIAQQWRDDLCSEDEDEHIDISNITNVTQWIKNLFEVSNVTSVIFDAIIFLGEKIREEIISMETISTSKFSYKILTFLRNIKNGANTGFESLNFNFKDRERIYQNFLQYAQSRGAKKTEEYTKQLRFYFEELRKSYTPAKFYRQLTMLWIKASQDGWDIDNTEIKSGYVIIKAIKINRNPIESAYRWKTDEDYYWNVTEFYIDDASNPLGLLNVLKSAPFNNGNKSIFDLPIPIYIELNTIGSTIKCFRDENKHWEIQGSYSKNDYLNSFQHFIKWIKTKEAKSLNLTELKPD